MDRELLILPNIYIGDDTAFSNNLLKLERTEIGLQLSLSNLEPFLKTAVSLANFTLSGKLLLIKESLTKNGTQIMEQG